MCMRHALLPNKRVNGLAPAAVGSIRVVLGRARRLTRWALGSPSQPVPRTAQEGRLRSVNGEIIPDRPGLAG